MKVCKICGLILRPAPDHVTLRALILAIFNGASLFPARNEVGCDNATRLKRSGSGSGSGSGRAPRFE